LVQLSFLGVGVGDAGKERLRGPDGVRLVAGIVGRVRLEEGAHAVVESGAGHVGGGGEDALCEIYGKRSEGCEEMGGYGSEGTVGRAAVSGELKSSGTV
jgi:hypothetical protein